MWIVLWNSFLIKVLVKKEVYKSCEQCTRPIKKSPQLQKLRNVLKKKKNSRRVNVLSKTGIMCAFGMA